MKINKVKEFVENHTSIGVDQFVQVNEVWDNRYRVNIWQTNPNKITKSFFVKASGEQFFCPELGA
jgi:hypothetical protein